MSFTIKCNKCGKEQQLIDNDDFKKLEISLFDDVNVFGGSYSKSIEISCDCGNTVTEEIDIR